MQREEEGETVDGGYDWFALLPLLTTSLYGGGNTRRKRTHGGPFICSKKWNKCGIREGLVVRWACTSTLSVRSPKR